MKMSRLRKIWMLLLVLCALCVPSLAVQAISLTKPVITKVKVADYNALTISWKVVPGADGYVLYRKRGNRSLKKIATIAGMENCSYTDQKLITGTSYTYAVKAYALKGTRKVYSVSSRTKSGKPAVLPPVITSVETPGSKTVKLAWDPVNGASGYVVYRATSATGKYTALKTLSGRTNSTYTDKSAANYKNYYYKVKAYRTVNGKKYYGKPSAYRKFKINVPVSEFTMLPGEKHLSLGKSATLTTTILPKNATDRSVKWVSSDPKTVSVTNGVIKSLKLGKAVITATASNGERRTCIVTSGLKTVTTLDQFIDESMNMTQKYASYIQNHQGKFFTEDAGRLILKTSSSNLDLSGYGGILDVIKGFENYYVIQFDSTGNAYSAKLGLKRLATVEFVESDSYYKPETHPEKRLNSMSWGVTEMGTDVLAKQVAQVTSDSIIVAVIDTGIDFENPFYKNHLAEGYDFINNSNQPQAKIPHGVHVAGTIIDNMPDLNVKIMPLRVFNDEEESGSLINGLAFLYATDKGAKVINYSVGGGDDPFLRDVIRRAVRKGVTVVISSGNEHKKIDQDCCPADMGEEDGIIVVSAVTKELMAASFSNYGEEVDLCAPGYQVLSYTLNSEVEKWDGTSMAAPHISAIAAMEKLLHPSASPAQIEQNIKERCYDLGDPGWDRYTGWGIPDYSGNGPKRIKSISLMRTEIKVNAGTSYMLAAYYSPFGVQEPELTWTSSDPSVATVEDGVVKGISAGTATITVSTSYDVSTSILVTVAENVMTGSKTSVTSVAQKMVDLQIAYRDADTYYKVPSEAGTYLPVYDTDRYDLRIQNLDPYAYDNLYLDAQIRLDGKEQIESVKLLLSKDQFRKDGSVVYYPLQELLGVIPDEMEFQLSFSLIGYAKGEKCTLYKGMEEAGSGYWLVKKSL